MSIWKSCGKKSSVGNTLTPPHDQILGVLSLSPQHPPVLRAFASFPGFLIHLGEVGQASFTSRKSSAGSQFDQFAPGEHIPFPFLIQQHPLSSRGCIPWGRDSLGWEEQQVTVTEMHKLLILLLLPVFRCGSTHTDFCPQVVTGMGLCR